MINHRQENPMLTRKEYVEQLKTKLDEWNADIGRWEEKARAAKNDLRIDYEMKLDDLRKKRDEATAKLKELQASSEEAWKELKAGADTAWTAMREAYDKAKTHFQK
jgi:uncharacterized coiled-coil DUF342 family protein